MLKKGSKLYSIFYLRCPRCHEGKLFETGSWSLRKPIEMNRYCPHCQLDLLPEPGYYYGAMFLSYIVSGFFSLGFLAFFHWVLGWSLMSSFGLLLAISVIFFVYFFRMARSMWLNLNVRYDASKAKKE